MQRKATIPLTSYNEYCSRTKGNLWLADPAHGRGSNHLRLEFRVGKNRLSQRRLDVPWCNTVHTDAYKMLPSIKQLNHH